MKTSNNSLQKHITIQHDDIDLKNYTVSLLNACSKYSLLSTQKLIDIKKEFDKEFVEVCEEYTCRESSSLPKNIAKNIYSSVFYQSDAYLLSLKSHGQALNSVRALSPHTLVQSGRTVILQMHEKSREIYEEAKNYRLDLPIIEYKYAMDTAFDLYYKKYSARFDACNCIADIEYPLLGRKAYEFSSFGAIFVYKYYSALLLENKFCSSINNDDLQNLLVGYGKIYHSDFKDLLINVAEIVANNLLANSLLGNGLYKVLLSQSDIETLRSAYCLCTKEILISEIKRSFFKYQEIMSPEVFNYISKYIPSFGLALKEHIDGNNLDNFLVVSKN